MIRILTAARVFESWLHVKYTLHRFYKAPSYHTRKESGRPSDSRRSLLLLLLSEGFPNTAVLRVRDEELGVPRSEHILCILLPTC